MHDLVVKSVERYGLGIIKNMLDTPNYLRAVAGSAAAIAFSYTFSILWDAGGARGWPGIFSLQTLLFALIFQVTWYLVYRKRTRFLYQ